ncbi:hypothetical protein EXIGLDRAFT_746223 [Exidia glandulosa HHB12029]|uniref:Uncharacterized protein n=1 Tax=Exidia glandulosa HHB12029 TaxID=1314781 RepID=A0A165MH17_EXIGL|nr:hypothetical protein EXIGLDRAFT_746223 [Exidia glandulosa HHB12029]
MSSDVFRCSPWVAYEPPAGAVHGDGADGVFNDSAGAGQDSGAGDAARAFSKFRVKLAPGQQTGHDGARTPDPDAGDTSAAVDDDMDDSQSALQPVVVAIPSELDQQQAMMATFEVGPGQDWKTAATKPPRKKPAKRGGVAGSAGTARGGMRKTATIKNAQRAIVDVEELADDVSYASSPAQHPRDLSVEPDSPYVPESDLVTHPTPVPSYTLPTRSFAVAAPIKTANTVPKDVQVDRNVTPVRRWRVARREIRGIAGGRWLARSWVGDTESGWADTSAEANAAAQLLSMAAGSSSLASAPTKAKQARRLVAVSTPIMVASSSPIRGGVKDGKTEDMAILEL